MTYSDEPRAGVPPQCSPNQEITLGQFVDGVLDHHDQADLFAHLAACATCRHTLDGVLTFRRLSRQEHLVVPPRADEVFFERLARLKAMNQQIDRAADRRPLWQARRTVSLRAAVVVAALVFLVGLLLPKAAPVAQSTPFQVFGEVEQVQFVPFNAFPHESVAVYVFYPGLTIEALKDDSPGLEPVSVPLESF